MTAQRTRQKPPSTRPPEWADAPPPELAGAAVWPRRQAAPVLAPPPDDSEKYAYIDRNLPYLTTGLVISAACLIISQLRFEAHSPALWPFMAFTATYVIYQVISLPVNFAGRGFDLAAHQARVRAWHPARVPERRHLPADLRRADRGAPQHLDRGRRAHRRPTRGRPRPTSSTTGRPTRPARWRSRFGFCYVRRPDLRAYKKSGNLRYAFARTSGEFLVIFDADFAPRPRLPGRDAALHGRPGDRDRPDAPVLPGERRRRPGSRTPRARSRRCSTGRSRWPGTGSARPSASGPPRSTGGPRWSRRAARRSSPTPRTCTPGWTCAGPAGPWSTCRSCCRPASARTTSTRSCASSTGGAPGTPASCSPAGCGPCR